MRDAPALIIFDCDGVLIDSEVIAYRVLSAELTRRGFPVSEAESRAEFIGQSAKGVAEIIAGRFAKPLPDDFWDTELEVLVAAMEAELKPIPGIFEVLDAIDLPACVASSSRMARLKPALEITGLHDRFAPNIFDAEMVERAKPAPDLFFLAARAMGVKPADCLVVEDSLIGVEGAVAAGMRVLGFTGGSHCGAGLGQALTAKGASTVFNEMRELPRLVYT